MAGKCLNITSMYTITMLLQCRLSRPLFVDLCRYCLKLSLHHWFIEHTQFSAHNLWQCRLQGFCHWGEPEWAPHKWYNHGGGTTVTWILHVYIALGYSTKYSNVHSHVIHRVPYICVFEFSELLIYTHVVLFVHCSSAKIDWRLMKSWKSGFNRRIKHQWQRTKDQRLAQKSG